MKKKSIISIVIIIVMLFNFIDHRLFAATTSLTLNGDNKQNENYITLNWNWSAAPATNYYYTVYQSDNNGAAYQTMPTLYDSKINILNVYNPTKDEFGTIHYGYLKEWMGTTVTDPSQGRMNITEIQLKDFNANPMSYLKDANGKWQYDAVAFGFADYNGAGGYYSINGNPLDLSASATTAIEQYIDSTHGVLFGHDTAQNPNRTPSSSSVNFNALILKYLNFSQRTDFTGSSNGSFAKVINDGFLLRYPWSFQLGQVLSIPYTHDTGELARGIVWLQFSNAAGVITDVPVDDATGNFYLTTWNNVAQIQTGHMLNQGSSSQQPTIDEKRILANTLFYLGQRTSATSLNAYSAIDKAPPAFTTLTRRLNENNGANIQLSANDIGTPYKFYVKATNENNSTDVYTSNETVIESASNLKGFIISESTAPTIERDANGIVTTPITVLASDNQVVTYTSTDATKQVYVVAVDNGGNASAPMVIEPYYIQLSTQSSNVYKPDVGNLSATIVSNNKTITGVKYLLLPPNDGQNFTTKQDFINASNAITDPDKKGDMNFFSGNQYNMIHSDPNIKPNGIQYNGEFWIMATAIDSNNNEYVTFKKTTIDNIYTPIHVFHTGSNSENTMYSKTLIPGTYGVRLDQTGKTMANAAHSNDTVTFQPLDFSPLWSSGESSKTLDLGNVGIQNFTTNSQGNYEYTYNFNFNRSGSGWHDIDVFFVDQDNNDIPELPQTKLSVPNQSIPSDKLAYFQGSAYYTLPTVADYLLESYTTSDGALSYAAPNKLDLVNIKGFDYASSTELYFVYKNETMFPIEETYTIYNEELDTTTTIASKQDQVFNVMYGDEFTGSTSDSLAIHGLMLSQYSIDNGDFQDFDGTPITLPYIDREHTIVYRYREDANQNGIPDENEREVRVVAVPLNASGTQVFEYLFQRDPFIVPKGNTFRWSDFDEEISLYAPVYDDGTNDWIFVDKKDAAHLNQVNYDDQAQIDQNTTYNFFYFMDTLKDGIPDYYQANVTVKTFVVPSDTESFTPIQANVTKHAPGDTFSYTAPTLPQFVYMGYYFYPDNQDRSAVNVNPSNEIEYTLDSKNYILEFEYRRDANNNGIPDDMEAAIYIHLDVDGTIATKSIIGKEGDPYSVDPWALGLTPDMYDFIGASTDLETANIVFNKSQSLDITLYYRSSVKNILTKIDQDTNHNGVPDYLEVDTNHNGVPDFLEADSNKNGIPDYLEADMDSNGIPDFLESDANHNGIPDYLEADTNSNGIPDFLEADLNQNGIPDYLEVDTNGNGIPDFLEADLNKNGIPDYLEVDTNGNDIPDFLEADLNKNGIPDYLEADTDGNGIPDFLEADLNKNGIPDYLEADSNKNGIPDFLEADLNKNGIPDYLEADVNGNGISDFLEADVNKNGIPDYLEADSNKNGIPDFLEADLNKNGIPDYLEADSNKNGIPDFLEADLNKNGIPDYLEADTDGNGIPDFLEADLNKNGIPDYLEADTNDNGIPDFLEVDLNKNSIPDYLEVDTNGNGIPDFQEKDLNHNGVPDYLEADINSNGIPDYFEVDLNQNGIPDYLEVDSDGNGIPDYLEADRNKNGILDFLETDFNKNGIPDYLETDNNKNGIPDFLEADLNHNGVPDYLEMDTNGNGIPDFLEADLNHNGVPDYLEVDTNDNGISDFLEADLNKNGTPDYLEVDLNKNNIPDYNETNKKKQGSNTSSNHNSGNEIYNGMVKALDNLANKESDPITNIEKKSVYFVDMDEKYAWAKDAIDHLVSKGVLFGVGEDRFEPGRNVTRAEFIMMIYKAFDIQPNTKTKSFSDVQASDWYYDAVYAAASQKIISGYPDGSFHPNNDIARQEMAKLIHSLLNKYAFKYNTSQTVAVKDENTIASYAKESVNNLYSIGVLKGYPDNTFKPLNKLTRAEAAVVIHHLLLLVEENKS